ncbi:SAGA complex subunit spt3 [Colletotrichum trifolii]|uniref:SAGA complex subunit spt3 n=1 Tax=Colletotrichum trifolii TaxID=5466 RepID=A0A4V3HWZ7_COLTR|nr:SAGA complex subunit spt3 [Colletotrichum trifolii]
MYIAGETQDVTLQTIKLIEDIILDQVVHMVDTITHPESFLISASHCIQLKAADDLANRRGSRVFSNNDLIFQVRHDVARVERLRTFLTWKVIRKTVRDSDEKEGFEEADLEADTGPTDDASANKTKLPTVSLPWEVASFFSEQVEVEQDISDLTGNEAALEKLRYNDERTRHMTVAEYATWSEYRHASMTYRKAKRFRDWVGLGVIAEHKPNDDVMDILGFLTSEMVQKLTAEALKVQQMEDGHLKSSRSPETRGDDRQGLFERKETQRKSIDVRHVRMAFQRLQGRTKQRRALLNGTRIVQPVNLRLL